MPVLETVDQARAAFTGAGYQVHDEYTWAWTSPPVSSFRVEDTIRGRVLMVQVYLSFDAAQTGRLQAESHEQTLSGGSPDANGTGPHLVDGYGPSVWSGNAALVQTTQSELNREYRAQIERDSDLYQDPAIQDLTPTNLAVDLDFLRALQSGAVNL